jgi:hypothetical protein
MLDSNNLEIVDYKQMFHPDKLTGALVANKKFKVNSEGITFKKSTRQYEICAGLVDTEIVMCSKIVLTQLIEDPGMDNIKEDFIFQLNASQVTADRVQAHILKDKHYYGRLNDPRTYQVISNDIIRRKCAPIVVDSPVFNQNTNLSVQPFNKYIA